MVELFEPVVVRGERSRSIWGRVGRLHPGLDVLRKNFVDECFNVQFDVVSSLNYIDAIVEVKIALSFDGFGEPLIN